MTKAYRYAIYFAPAPQSLWWQTGSQWLGRCAADQSVKAMPRVEGISAEDHRQVTAAPRRYGWHATLKAPFALAEGVTVQQLESALKVIAQSTRAFDMPPLKVTLLDDFLALIPASPSQSANELAARCVVELQALAAPLSPSELQRRRKAPLSAAQDALLLRWGYPFVLDQYQLHFSLTGTLNQLPPAPIGLLHNTARAWFAPLGTCRFESLAVFAEPNPGDDFVLKSHFALQTDLKDSVWRG